MDAAIYVEALKKGDDPEAIVSILIRDAQKDWDAQRLQAVDRERFRSVIPLSNHAGTMTNASVNLPYEMSEAEWDRFMAILDLWKPVLVKPGDDSDVE
jgi:hypothetical protein